MKKLLLALGALLSVVSVTANAQTKPPDVPDYIPVTPVYATGTTPNVLGDGSNVRGGTMPVLASQPADIPSTATGWIATGSSFLVCSDNLAGKECKFRSHSNISHISFDDPIRNYGQPGASHCHEFFGSTSTNAYSTYASLRNRANQAAAAGRSASTFAGGPYNATGYWFPCLVKTNPFGDGKNYVVRPSKMVVYYAENPGTGTLYGQRLPRGLRYVLGVNMDDPDNCGVKNEINLANGGPGTGCVDNTIYYGYTSSHPEQGGGSGRYRQAGSGGAFGAGYGGNGFGGWQCLTNNDVSVPTAAGYQYSAALTNPDGSDPWNGACIAGYQLQASVNAPRCYDGRNLWAPGGYKHMRRGVYDTVASIGAGCPTGWYRLVILEITFYFTHQGWTDYQNWRLSSDDMAATLTGHTWLNGSSFHTDWMNGWDDTTLYGSADGTTQGWLQFCVGVATPSGTNADPHTCDSSTIRNGFHLLGGYNGENAPDLTRQPQVNYDINQFTTANAAGMQQLPLNNGRGGTTAAIPK